MEDRIRLTEERLDAHANRLDEHHDRLTRAETEIIRARGRLHELETDRSTIRHLARITQQLAERTQDAWDQIEGFVDRAVDKVDRRRRDEHRDDWRYRLGWIAAAALAGTFLIEHHHTFGL